MEPIEPELFEGDAIRQSETNASAARIDRSYYDFSNYVSKTRMLTFWHQLDDVLATEPESVLEIGVGPAVVSGTIRALGIPLTTVDVNPALRPDLVGSILELDKVVEAKSFDTVLCARVLHHLSFSDFDTCLEQLARVTKGTLVLTLPVDEARIYLAARRTAQRYRVASIRLPAFVKKAVLRLGPDGEKRYQQLWKIDSHPETSSDAVTAQIERHFKIVNQYRMDEDQSHAFFVLTPR